jgi:hypothetical protein
MKNKIIFLILFVMLGFFFTPVLLSAQDTDKTDIRELKLQVPIEGLDTLGTIDEQTRTLPNGDTETYFHIPWLAKYLRAVLQYLFVIGSVMAVVMLMWGGISYNVSGLNIQVLEKAKSTMWTAVFGLLIMMGTYTMLNVLNPELISMKYADINVVKKVEMTCCESLENPGQRMYAFGEQAEGQTSACPAETKQVTANNCENVTVFGSPCCMTPGSTSNIKCEQLGGKCTKVFNAGDSTCASIAEAIGWVAGGGVAAAETVTASIAKSFGKNVFKYGWKIATKGVKTAASATIHCALSATCIVSVAGGYAAWESGFFDSGESCDGDIGVCSDIGSGFVNGDACIDDKQCAPLKCCKQPPSWAEACWGKDSGYCTNGQGSAAGAQGTGQCGNDNNCCFAPAKCEAYYKSLKGPFDVDNVFYNCSTGDFGHACGTTEYCKPGLICESNQKVCIDPNGIPAGQTVTCTNNSDCEMMKAFCSSDMNVTCANNTTYHDGAWIGVPGCVSKSAVDAAFCINKYSKGELCLDDVQCRGKCLKKSGKINGHCICLSDNDCASGSYCDSSGSCTQGTITEGGTCNTNGECADSLVCIKGGTLKYTCQMVRSEGQDCYDELECAKGISCFGISSNNPGECKSTTKGYNVSCEDKGECLSDDCRSDNKCACKQNVAGANCSVGEYCRDDGYCATKKGPGEDCSTSMAYECASEKCVEVMTGSSQVCSGESGDCIDVPTTSLQCQ